MDWNFGVMELIFLVSCAIIFIRSRMHRTENEIDKVMREAEQVKYKNIDILICRSEVYDGQIFVWERYTNKFITQQPNIENTFKYFIDNYPGKRIHFGEK